MGTRTITKAEVSAILGALFVYDNGYCEYREINDNRFGVVKPITKNVVRNIIAGMDESANQLTFQGLVPEELIYFRTAPILHMMWTVPEGVHNLHFTDKEHNGKYVFPKVLLRLYGKQLYVYGFKTYFGAGTKLYSLDVPNVDSYGKICLGSAKINVDRMKYYDEVMATGYKSFFTSKFTNSFNEKTLTQSKDKKVYDNKLLTKKIDTINGLLRSTP